MSYGLFNHKELIFGFQILDLKDRFLASSKNSFESDVELPREIIKGNSLDLHVKMGKLLAPIKFTGHNTFDTTYKNG